MTKPLDVANFHLGAREWEGAGGGDASINDAGGVRIAPIGARREGTPGRRADVLVVTSDNSLIESLSLLPSPFGFRAFAGHLTELELNSKLVKVPDVLAVDFRPGNAPDLETLERLKKSSFSNVPIVVLSNPADKRIVRGLMQIKVDDWLPADCSAEEVIESFEQAVRVRQFARSDVQIKCTAFFPAHGGCGNTTLAIESAFLIGGQNKQLSSTCLVDLNFQDGAVADYLDLTPSFELCELTNMSRRLDGQLLEAMLTRHSSGLAVLASPRAPGQYIEPGEELITSILGHLSDAFDNLIIDLPRRWAPWTDNVVWGADRICVVTGFTVPGLRHARLLTDAIVAKAAAKAKVSVIVNKYHEPLMGACLTRKDAETILQSRLGGVIPNLGWVVDDAVNRGMTLSEARAGNKIGKRLSQILDNSGNAGRAGKG
jgi:pilus assembly protein CpaE